MGMSVKISEFLIATVIVRNRVLARRYNLCRLLFLLLLLPAQIQSQFTYETNNGTITITGYTGSGGDVTVPESISGLPVTSIGSSAFNNGCPSVSNITAETAVQLSVSMIS